MKLTQRLQEIANLPDYQDISKEVLAAKLLAYQGSARFTAFRGISKREDLNKYDAYFVEVNGAKKKNPNAIKNPYMEGGIYNYAEKVNIVTGFDYDNSMGIRLKKAGIDAPFEGGTSWHFAVSRALAVHKKDVIFKEDGDFELTENPRFYFRYQYLENSNSLLEHYHKNDNVAYQLFQSFLQKNEHYGIQKRHGLEDGQTLNIQLMALDHILTIHIDHEKYRLIENVRAFHRVHLEQEELAIAE